MKSFPGRRTNTILAQVLLALILTPPDAFTQQPANQPNSNQPISELPEVSFGVPVSKTIAAGEAQSFRMTITAAHFVSVIAEPQQVNLALRIFGIDGRVLAEVDTGENGDSERIA